MMEKGSSLKPWEQAVLCLYVFLFGFALGANIGLMATSRDWGMRLFVFLFFLVPTLFAFYLFLRKAKAGNL